LAVRPFVGIGGVSVEALSELQFAARRIATPAALPAAAIRRPMSRVRLPRGEGAMRVARRASGAWVAVAMAAGLLASPALADRGMIRAVGSVNVEEPAQRAISDGIVMLTTDPREKLRPNVTRAARGTLP
jgi:hypothetical protein